MHKSDRTIAERDPAVETETVAARSRDVRTESRRSEFCSRIRTSKKVRRSGFLNGYIQTENWRVKLSEDSENITIGINYRDRHSSVAADRLSDRRSDTI